MENKLLSKSNSKCYKIENGLEMNCDLKIKILLFEIDYGLVYQYLEGPS